MRNVCSLAIVLFTMLISTSCQKSNDPAPTNLQVGQSYKGGIIFYLDASNQHGLVAAPTDQSTNSMWNTDSVATTDSYRTEVGTGDLNTDAIIKVYGSANYAASVCRSYKGGNFNDWFLPSKDELNLMYQNLKQKGLGSFADEYYWSSSSRNDQTALIEGFKDGEQTYEDKDDNFMYTRAVRKF